MKFSAVAASMFTLIGCIEETFKPDTETDGGVVTLTAYMEGGQTKTVLDGTFSKWAGDEWIQIAGRNGNYWFCSEGAVHSSVATFTYNGDNGEYNEGDILAVYPAGSVAYSPDYEDLSVSNVTVPSDQAFVAGSYDPAAAVSIAYSTDGKSLRFKNVTSLLKFTMGSDNVKNVTIWGDVPEVDDPDSKIKSGYVYLKVTDDWKQDGARFAAYFFGNGDTWRSMTAVEGETNLYTCELPSGYPNVIFCRMNPGSSVNGWDSKWNQSEDITLSEENLFTITDSWGDDGNGKKARGEWSSLPVGKLKMGISGTGKVTYNDGQPVMENAGYNYVSMTGDFVKGETYYLAVAPTTFANGFTVQFSDTGNSDKYDVKSTSNRIELRRNVIYDLGNMYSTRDMFYTDPPVLNADSPCDIYFQPASDNPLYSQTGDLYAHIWLPDVDNLGSSWGDNSEKYKLTKIAGKKLWKMTVSSSLREFFGSGTNPCETIGILARTADASKKTDDYMLYAVDKQYGVSIPSGAKQGINYNDDGTVTLVFYDSDRSGNHYEWCYVLSELSDWNRDEEYKMIYDSKISSWWITLDGLDPDKEYKFQYSLGNGADEVVRTFDPYTEIVYSTYDDKWIPDDVYPGLWDDYRYYYDGKAYGYISAFQINRPEYEWKVTDFKIEDKDDLVIYELLLRDFTDNAYREGSLKAAMEYLDYIEDLGVNAIELMPVQEFDGNDSWGYNPCAYFALDKVYGTREDYKMFIDECHSRGIAVILDVVYNHVTGSHPYAAQRFIYDGDNSRPDPQNPWFNEYSPHQFSVHSDWDHSNGMFRDHMKQSLEYLLNEYKIDGFRFDLSKGFTQNSGKEESYDESRVGYLKEYNYHIYCVNSNAVVICEHLVDAENVALGNDGMYVWRNMNEPYIKAMKRDMSLADFRGTTNNFDNSSGMMSDEQNFGMLVGYQESHDEQRTNFEGQWDYTGASIDFATRIERAKINAAFFLMSPGPKMIWQFGEIGYDISIDENGRTGKKPWRTDEYMAVPERKALYDTYARLLKFRNANPRFFDYDVNFRWYVDREHQEGRYLFSCNDGKHFALFGNFGNGEKTISVSLPDGVSTWYQYDDRNAVWNGSYHEVSMKEGQFYLLVSDPSLCL